MCLRERVTERRKTWVKDNIRVHAHIRAERERERERERREEWVNCFISLSLSQALSLFFWNSWHHRSVVMCPVCLSVCLSLSQSLSLPLFIYIYIYIYIYICVYIYILSPSLPLFLCLSPSSFLSLSLSLFLSLFPSLPHCLPLTQRWRSWNNYVLLKIIVCDREKERNRRWNHGVCVCEWGFERGVTYI